MKIAHVNPSFHPATYYGGPTTSGFETCKALAARGASVRVLTTNANGPHETTNVQTGVEQELDGFTVRYCDRRLPESVAPSMLARLPEIVRWADVVHLTAVYNFTTFPTMALCRALDKPLLWTPRGAHLEWSKSRRQRAKTAWDRTVRGIVPNRFAVHATSEREAEAIRRKLPGSWVRVIPNGVVIPAPPTAGSRPADASLHLAFVGRLDPIKGIENLLDACALLDSRGLSDWALSIAGSGPPAYARALRERARPLGDRVEWLGKVGTDGKRRLLENTDILVLPSHSENFGIVAAEALAAAVPVIASTGTPWQDVTKRDCGLWVDNHASSLCDAIIAMSAADRVAMGNRGRAWMEQEFAWPVVAERLLDLMSRLAR